MPMTLTPHPDWGRFYARERLSPMAERAAGWVDPETRGHVEQLIRRCDSQGFDATSSLDLALSTSLDAVTVDASGAG